MTDKMDTTAETPLPTAAMVADRLSYNPETGVFTWKASATMSPRWNATWAGKRAGTARDTGYRVIGLFERLRYEHRLAILLATGEWPAADVDHINMDKGDNRLANLRTATRSQNKANGARQANNRSGAKGVVAYLGRYKAQITVAGRRVNIGTYDTVTEAQDAYMRVASEHFGSFARGA